MGWFWRDAESGVDAQELAEPARHTTPAGRYTVSVRLVEAKNLQAIQAFNFFQTLMSFKLKTQTVHADRLPSVVGKVYLERAGFDPQKRKTVVEKETASPLWNQLFYFDTVEVATDELEACNVVVRVCDKSRNRQGHGHREHRRQSRGGVSVARARVLERVVHAHGFLG